MKKSVRLIGKITMKEALINIVTIIVFALFLSYSGCAGNAKKKEDTGEMTLDKAITEATNRINERIAAGVKIAPLNFNSPSDKFSSYVLEELTANLVDTRKLTVVDRKEIDLIRSEFDFQYSGEVGDDSMQTLGRMLGAQSIISGSLTDMGGFYRIVIRVLNVQNASVEVQYRTNIVNDNIVTALLSGGKTNTAATIAPSGNASTSVRTTTSNNNQAQTQQIVQVPTPAPTQPSAQASAQSKGVIAEGGSLAEKLQWLEENAKRNTEYFIEVTNNENVTSKIFSYSARTNIIITLSGGNSEKTISLTGRGSLFTVESGVTLVLDNNITLKGVNGNDAALVRVNSGGTLIMNSEVKITDNSNRNYPYYVGGVYLSPNSVFNMQGGEISGNSDLGVYTDSNSLFTMRGGEIYGNKGGVHVKSNFTMEGGEIYGNTSNRGGGVYIDTGNFIMKGGVISGNTASNNGGGVYAGGSFNMTGGIISGNIASTNGGGVYISDANFSKTGGTIYGYANESNANINKTMQGISTNNRGHAVFIYNGKNNVSRENTAGPDVKLSYSRSSGASGAWEN